jgi:hypothetical protein
VKKGLAIMLGLFLLIQTAMADTQTTAVNAALDYLAAGLTANEVWVYRDYAETVNHFTQKALISDSRHAEYVSDMNENWQDSPHSGTSAIECRIHTESQSWGGWMFMNGYLLDGETIPSINWGDRDGTGENLSGATRLTFWAKGAQGGERVQFFLGGVGYDEWGNTTQPYPDSTAKISTKFLKLTSGWKMYTLSLKKADLSYLNCGFGFVLSSDKSGKGDTVFYLDDIRFEGDIASNMDAPQLLASYETDNPYIHNAAFSYDNALVAMAFIASGRQNEAKEILDAFVYAVENDRYASDRIRNAYAVGDVRAFTGWGGKTRLPGWYDQLAGAYYEDRYQVGTATGNTAYVALALLQYDRVYNDVAYRRLAQTLMDWVIDNCSDSTDGFTAGYDGWPEAGVVYPFTYKSIEHNIDAYSAFSRLYELTGESRYANARDSSLRFIKGLYEDEKGYFYTGTTSDGFTPSTQNVVLDAQVWAALALGEEYQPYRKTAETALAMKTDLGGYPFHANSADKGTWLEGTAFTALAFSTLGMQEEADAALKVMRSLQLDSGAFPAATVEALETGFELFNGTPWTYSNDAHIAPTAWYVMACLGFNPYSFAD